WMADHQFSTIVWAVERGENTRSLWGHIVNPVEFALSQLLALVLLVVIALPLLQPIRGRKSLTPPDVELSTLERHFLCVVCLGPFLLDLVISVTPGVQLQSAWGAPMWNFSGLCLLAWRGIAVEIRVYRTVVLRCAIAGLVIATVFAGRNVVLPHLR